MARTAQNENKAGTFFLATLVLWFVSVWFEIVFNKRQELLWVIAGCCFFQTANWVIRFCLSRDPLFVNTSVSLLHSSITSVSVVFILVNQWLKNGSNGMLSTHSCLGVLGHGHILLCVSLVVTLHMISWICCITGYTVVGSCHLSPSSNTPNLRYACFISKCHHQLPILTLICELHSIFLHVRKVRRMAGIRDAKSKIVKLEWVLNWVTFILARVVSHILITAKLIRDAHKKEKNSQANDRRRHERQKEG
ncbi:hypothetical protein SLA2020_264510 [Shorea laevis]